MKVILSEDNKLEFDNGLSLSGYDKGSCCAVNYLDFEQFTVGTEFPDMTDKQFIENYVVKEDGFALTDSQGLPKWCQARSNQNGYYSDVTFLEVTYNGVSTPIAELSGEIE
jgi:hypothetical protein